MRLEELLPEIRKGRRARCKSWPKSSELQLDDGGDLDIGDVFADDWELVPESVVHAADYLVPYGVGSSSVIYIKEIHPVGQQPEGSVMVPGSKRN
jgi:hypothetical protein